MEPPGAAVSAPEDVDKAKDSKIERELNRIAARELDNERNN